MMRSAVRVARPALRSTAVVSTRLAAPLVQRRDSSSLQVTISGLNYVGTGLAAIALAGVGVGIGNVFGNFLLAAARQPNLMKALFNYAILGFALTEAIGLFALMIAFLMLFS
eukprot:TRINITY_DN786_c0_g1_i6.p2 TRINITY_DN786_c0_g1~~TRINITY_DN786_c0_g1_i6.p2  ORF type:complete len:112 (+),score=30.20 TRINITY_DN786_c0_g1_i6:73-408(+)